MFEHVKCETPDLAKQNLEKLKALFPGVVTEGPDGMVINIEALRQECSATPIEGNVEHYEFTWPGKMKAKAEANRPTTKTLRPCRAESVGKDGTPGGFDSENLYIEGDNLEVLKLLRMNYAGAVKMIYIDPPYNTGKDFVYRDSFSLTEKEVKNKAGSINEDGAIYEKNDSAEARYHTNWCNMMLPRLRLAKDLLRDDGFVFISIDDKEVANLRKLGDEVFGAENFVANFLWKKKGTTSNVEGAEVSSLADSTLCYRRSVLARIVPRVKSKETRVYPEHDEEGAYRLTVIEKKDSGGYKRETMKFSIIGHYPRDGKRWQIGADTAKELERKNRFVFDGEKVQLKIYDFEDKDTTSAWPNILENCGSSDSAAQMVNVELFECPELFDNPKPIELVEHFVQITTSATDLIMDFFSGSATTAHAVMQLNAEDGGERKIILVQFPELTYEVKDGKKVALKESPEAFNAGYENICEIGKERIRRAGKKIFNELKAQAEKVKGELALGCSGEAVVTTKPDVGFRVLKLSDGSYYDTSKKVGEITQESLLNFSKIKDDRTGEDLLFQMLLETDVKLSESIDEEIIEGNKVYFVGGTAIAAALEKDMKMTEEFVKALAARKPGTVFFRDDAFGGKDDLKISVGQIFKQMTGDITKVKVI